MRKFIVQSQILIETEVHANSEEEALESYHGYNPTDTETIDVSFEDAKEIEDGEY